ncbi:carbon monoxide dehydrogenase [Aminobacter sp. DSM 101952]|uniref:SRPBCC family protein n=1 Tax=Aminobacter sp. DSM 101952 TaxID=2735891 RepID=UPI0006FEF9E4|nr:carbon monoxide dehydrogenase subunit G [Aminobacter sp. DSM 101952]KQU71524.1 carbon monoxide dehydrogenase [Aminobacter sp. DSM 101952]
MDMTGEQLIPAPREAVWNALNDITVLKDCIPGCTFLEEQEDGSLAAKSVLRIGPIKATFSGKVTFSNIIPMEGYCIVGEGQGGVAGFAKGGADVHLRDAEGGTMLVYTAKADIGGKLAQLGSRLIDSTSKKLAGEFFERFASEVVSKVSVPA